MTVSLPRVHVLGVGAIGTLMASYLRQRFPALPLTLVLRNQAAADRWNAAHQTLALGQHTSVQGPLPVTTATPPQVHWRLATGIDAETLTDSSSATSPIACLVVTTKAYQTRAALAPLRARLDSHSVVVLLQNGLGVREELEKALFDRPATRPQFILATTTHGCYATASYRAVHAGFGGLWFAVVPSSNAPSLRAQAVADLLLALPLQPHAEPWPQFQIRLLTKLAVNACINPITALHRCRNGALISHPKHRITIDHLCQETSTIITRYLLEHQMANATSDLAFSPQELCQHVVEVCQTTAKNKSSMYQDVLHQRPTEIDYINGWLVRQAQRYRIPYPTHQALVAAIHAQEAEYRMDKDA
ncbi:2-dehydropantoate 2-reductase (Ketopantoate reductase) (KPA reductase) (KPR) [Dimargaris verticillata]|uniref:2-dehydropantoate 2-reductase n=1 Tax=Dimargaris verticillata TaxID=2761393 RepID=A0A9W8B7A2_9FUNG|nr:2-dehydropantoate 2-reductase (Ketopantoate reductase) (KPA reductase) (KPR) [Dimargaris verticillata]